MLACVRAGGEAEQAQVVYAAGGLRSWVAAIAVLGIGTLLDLVGGKPAAQE
jgi:hypothetical protein